MWSSSRVKTGARACCVSRARSMMMVLQKSTVPAAACSHSLSQYYWYQYSLTLGVFGQLYHMVMCTSSRACSVAQTCAPGLQMQQCIRSGCVAMSWTVSWDTFLLRPNSLTGRLQIGSNCARSGQPSSWDAASWYLAVVACSASTYVVHVPT